MIWFLDTIDNNQTRNIILCYIVCSPKCERQLTKPTMAPVIYKYSIVCFLYFTIILANHPLCYSPITLFCS